MCEQMPPRNDIQKPAKNVPDKKKKEMTVDAPKLSKPNAADDKIKKNRLLRNNDLLAQSSTETLLDMLKANSGIKECSDETVAHINGVRRVDETKSESSFQNLFQTLIFRRFSQNCILE